METYTYKNISVNVETSTYSDMTGETTMTVKTSFIAELLENSCSFFEFFKFDCEDIYTENDEYLDLMVEYFNNLEVSTYEIRNADAIIAVYEYCLENENETFNFDCETENISWIIHDILHAIHDAAGCAIYVDSEVEAQRIIKSLSITKENFLHLLPDATFLENLESEFFNRFKKHLDLEEFKYLDEELEEEY